MDFILLTCQEFYFFPLKAVQDVGRGNQYENNLVVLMLCPGEYNGRNEKRLECEAAIEVQKGLNVYLSGNAVAGSECAGFRIDGQSCSGLLSDTWNGNVAHTARIGVLMFPDDGLPGQWDIFYHQR